MAGIYKLECNCCSPRHQDDSVLKKKLAEFFWDKHSRQKKNMLYNFLELIGQVASTKVVKARFQTTGVA